MIHSGLSIISCGEVDSTNDEARRQLAANQSIVWATNQTAGRGRHGRSWYSPEGNLYCSIILHLPMYHPPTYHSLVHPNGTGPAAGFEQGGELSLLTALAVREGIASLLPDPATCLLKWPNDVLIAGRKVAGILLEAESLKTESRWGLIIGIGVNLRDFPQSGALPNGATSLWHQGAEVLSPLDFLSRMIPYWLDLYQHWKDHGFAAIRSSWLAHSYALGELTYIRQGSRRLEGRFVTLDDSGALLLEPPAKMLPAELPHPVLNLPASSLLIRITSGELFFPQLIAEP